jgi:hypothetical protein
MLPDPTANQTIRPPPPACSTRERIPGPHPSASRAICLVDCRCQADKLIRYICGYWFIQALPHCLSVPTI